jgi:hypothetical protein
MNTAMKAPETGDQPDNRVHVYPVTAANKTVAVMMGVIQLCVAGWLCCGLLIPHLRARFAHSGLNFTANIIVVLLLLGLALFTAVRPFQMHVTITNSVVKVVGAFSTHTVPFADILGRRLAAGRGVRGMYLYRQSKSRVFVRESLYRPDSFYSRWKASIYDLDKADGGPDIRP